MQAGESLSFIPIPEALATPEIIPDDEREYATYHFYRFVKEMLTNPVVQSLQRPEEFGTVTAKEASFQLVFQDGSYLYLVAYGHEYEDDYLDLGLSITEHTHEGEYIGGYCYELSGVDLRYSAHYAPIASSDDQYEEEKTYHFSLLDQYLHMDELEFLKITADEATRQQVESQYEAWKEAADLELASKDLGLTWRVPSAVEITLLKEITELARPFKVEQH